MTPHDFLDAIRAYIAAVGGRVTNYGRDVENNAAVGGVAHSPHVAWVGADIVYASPRPITERDEWARRLGLRIVHRDSHDHVQPASWEAG